MEKNLWGEVGQAEHQRGAQRFRVKEKRQRFCPLERHVTIIMSHWDVSLPGGPHVARKGNKSLGLATGDRRDGKEGRK